MEGMVGGVGIANFLWTGFGSIEAPIVKKAKADDDDEDDVEDEDDDDEEVWEGMSEVEDEGSSDSEGEEVAPKKKSAKRS